MIHNTVNENDGSLRVCVSANRTITCGKEVFLLGITVDMEGSTAGMLKYYMSITWFLLFAHIYTCMTKIIHIDSHALCLQAIF